MANERQAAAEAAARDHSGRLGASRAAAVLGKDPHCTPYVAWLEIMGDDRFAAITRPSGLDEAAYWGVVDEPGNAQRYSEHTGLRLARINRTLVHPEHPWLTCHLDRRVLGAPIIWQGKNRRYTDGWGDPDTDEIPRRELIQVTVESAIAHLRLTRGVEREDLSVKFAGCSWVRYQVQRNDRAATVVIERLAEWWRQHVELGEEPEPMTEADAKLRWHRATDQVGALTAEAYDAVSRYLRAEAVAKAAAKEMEAAGLVLRRELGQFCELVADATKPLPKRRAVVRWGKQERFNEAEFLETGKRPVVEVKQLGDVRRPELVLACGHSTHAHVIPGDDAPARSRCFKCDELVAACQRFAASELKKLDPKVYKRYKTDLKRGSLSVTKFGRELLGGNSNGDDDGNERSE